MSEVPPPVEIATCEKHGLKYNAATHSGCVRCRREQGEASPPGVARAAAPGADSLPRQALISLALIVATGFLFFTVHRELLGSFEGWISGGVAGFGSGSEESTNTSESDRQMLEIQVEFFLDSLKDPEVAQRRREDPELDRLISQLEDPERRQALSPTRIMEIMNEIDERLYYGGEN